MNTPPPPQPDAASAEALAAANIIYPFIFGVPVRESDNCANSLRLLAIEMEPAFAPLRARLATLEAENAALKAKAELAGELADMIRSYRDALYDGPENLTGLTNDRLETEAGELLAKHVAAKEER